MVSNLIRGGKSSRCDYPVISRHGQAKLTETKVLAIRDAVANGMSQASMVRMYGVSVMAINSIVHRRTWVQI